MCIQQQHAQSQQTSFNSWHRDQVTIVVVSLENFAPSIPSPSCTTPPSPPPPTVNTVPASAEPWKKAALPYSQQRHHAHQRGRFHAVPQAADIFHLSSIDQEETVLLLFPDAFDPKDREILFVRETSPSIAIWEGAEVA